MLEMGVMEQTIAKQAVRCGQPLPDRIANSPELINGLQLYLAAFFELDSERSHAVVPVSIPWSSIKEYAIAFEFDEEQTENLFFYVRKMDTEHLKKVAKKIKAANGG